MNIPTKKVEKIENLENLPEPFKTIWSKATSDFGHNGLRSYYENKEISFYLVDEQLYYFDGGEFLTHYLTISFLKLFKKYIKENKIELPKLKEGSPQILLENGEYLFHIYQEDYSTEACSPITGKLYRLHDG